VLEDREGCPSGMRMRGGESEVDEGESDVGSEKRGEQRIGIDLSREQQR